MTFSSPIWLIGLLPWLAVVVWVLRGTGTPVAVPFLELWRGPVTADPVRRRWRPPQLAVAAVLVAALLALLSAARPSIGAAQTSQPRPLRVVVDRGISMSGRSPARPLFHALADELQAELVARSPDRRLHVEFVPPTEPLAVRADDLARAVRDVPPTAVDTSPLLPAAIRAARADPDDSAILVISNQELPADVDRVVRIAPDAPLRNVAIASLAARVTPRPQLMVTLTRTSSDEPATALRIKSGGTSLRHVIAWTAEAREQSAFTDLPADVGSVIEVSIEQPDDDVAADDLAWLTLEGADPSIELRATVPPSLERMIEATARIHPRRDDDDDATPIAVVTDLSAAPGNAPCAIVVASSGAPLAPVTGAVAVGDHPVTSHVEWPALADAMRLAPAPPDDGSLRPILQIGDRPAVAVADEPVRRVWVGVDVRGWERSADFVIFWTNVFDWLAGDRLRAFRAQPVGSVEGPMWLTTGDPGQHGVEPGLWPGVYQREDGSLVAVNAPAWRGALATTVDDGERLADMLDERVRSAQAPLAAGLALVAVGCLLLAATAWPVLT